MMVRVKKTDETLLEIEEVSNEYLPLAKQTAKIFFTLDSMGIINYLYQFSLQHYMDGVFHVLKDDQVVNEVPKSDPQRRL